MNSTLDPLAKFRPAGQGPKANKSAVEPSDVLQPYVAFKPSKDERRYLELRCKFPDPSECPLNAMITSVTGEWRMGLAITLTYGNSMVVCIRGERLTELFRALLNWKVEWIAEFDPQEHSKPAGESDAPFIESITIHTTRPDDVPPASQRH